MCYNTITQEKIEQLIQQTCSTKSKSHNMKINDKLGNKHVSITTSTSQRLSSSATSGSTASNTFYMQIR